MSIDVANLVRFRPVNPMEINRIPRIRGGNKRRRLRASVALQINTRNVLHGSIPRNLPHDPFGDGVAVWVGVDEPSRVRYAPDGEDVDVAVGADTDTGEQCRGQRKHCLGISAMDHGKERRVE